MTNTARLITIEVTLCDSFAACEETILTALQSHGQPVSLCVVDVNVDRQTAIVNALMLPKVAHLVDGSWETKAY